jgi:hypothetical protein
VLCGSGLVVGTLPADAPLVGTLPVREDALESEGTDEAGGVPVVGAVPGLVLGRGVGVSVGVGVGPAVGSVVGVSVGTSVAAVIGASVGTSVGAAVGTSVRSAAGVAVGSTVDSTVGTTVGTTVTVAGSAVTYDTSATDLSSTDPSA